MAIALTDAHRKRMLEQVQMGVLNLQDSVARNAATHRQWAINEMPLSELQEAIANTIQAYIRIRTRLRNFRNNVADQAFADVGADIRLDLTVLRYTWEALSGFIVTFDNMPKTTYEEIIAACDYLIANVNPAPSVWEE
jgi:hypothetical protein